MTSQDIQPIPSEAYPKLAKRPMNSRLDTTKIIKTFMLELPDWKAEAAAMVKLALINA